MALRELKTLENYNSLIVRSLLNIESPELLEVKNKEV